MYVLPCCHSYLCLLQLLVVLATYAGSSLCVCVWGEKGSAFRVYIPITSGRFFTVIDGLLDINFYEMTC